MRRSTGLPVTFNRCRNENTDLVKKIERESHQQLRGNIGRRSDNGRYDKFHHDGMPAVLAHECSAHDAETCEKINQDGKFKNNARCQHQRGHKRDIRIHRDEVLHFGRDLVIAEKIHRERNDHEIREADADNEKHGSNANKSARGVFLLIAQSRVNEAPYFAKHVREADNDACENGYPDMLGELAGNFGVDQVEMYLLNAVAHAHGIAVEQVMREPAKTAVGDKIGMLGAEKHGTENKIVEEKKRSGQHRNYQCRTDQVPAKRLEVIEETHFLFSVLFLSHF